MRLDVSSLGVKRFRRERVAGPVIARLNVDDTGVRTALMGTSGEAGDLKYNEKVRRMNYEAQLIRDHVSDFLQLRTD